MSTQAALCSALERLNHFCKGEIAIKELLDRVDQLNSELRRVAEILSDADADAETNRRVKELSYDIEDSVECFVRRQEAEVWSSASKWSSYLRCLSKYCSSERSFLEDLHAFSRRGKEVTGSSSSSSRGNPEPQLIDRRFIGETNYLESFPIGLAEYQRNLMELLVGGELRLSVVSICGMGGIGKTTLAQSAFAEPSVVDRFHWRAWVNMSQERQVRDLLKDLLSALGTYTNKIEAMETMELAESIYKALKGRKYLICLDDVWTVEAWDSVRFVFPDDCNGSRILITTRLMDVARYTSRSTPPILIEPLTEEQSWELFMIKSGLQGYSDPVNVEIAKQILSSCRGLPLAISLIGSILSTTDSQNWDLILRNLHSDQKDLVLPVLDLSYKHLPFRLKPCFLYMGHFPPHQPISVDKLHLLWMAEGLMSKTKEADEDYFKELVDRNLVVVVEKEDSLALRKFRSGQVHELLRDLCISRGKQEEFFEVIDYSRPNKLTSTSTCRLAVYLDKFEDTNDVPFNIDAKRIRSILFFDSVESMPKSTWPSEVADLSNFQRIRVLDFDGVNFKVKRLPRGIEKLIYLRYLSFQGCHLQKFPSSFGGFSFLETLDLRVVDSCVMTIPNVLRKLTRLRHLYFPLAFQCDGKDKLKLDCLKSLEVVENFDAGSCEAGDLLQLENVQILKGIVDDSNSDLVNIINSIKKMNSNCYSSLVIKRFDSYSKQRRSIVAELLQCEGVHALELEGHLGAFPQGIVFGVRFTEMVFNGSEFSENPMSILGQLPHLRSLVLCNDAVLKSKLVCCESDFPQLKSLKLATLQYLEEWEVESGAMPNLTIFTIEQCHKLEMLPSELAEIPTLEKLMIGSMPQNFQLKVKEIIEDAAGMGYEIQVTFYDC